MGEPEPEDVHTHIYHLIKVRGYRCICIIRYRQLWYSKKKKISIFQNSLYLMTSHWPAKTQIFIAFVRPRATHRENLQITSYTEILLLRLIMTVMKKQSE